MMKVEFYASRRHQDSINPSSHQSARTVILWRSGSQNSDQDTNPVLFPPSTRDLVTSTVEDIRFPLDDVIFNIRQVTASWDAYGNINFTIPQYEDQEGIDYGARYILL